MIACCLKCTVHCTGVIVNYDYVCDIKVRETVIFTPMRLYRLKVRYVLKTIAIEKQSKLLVYHRSRRLYVVIKQSATVCV